MIKHWRRAAGALCLSALALLASAEPAQAAGFFLPGRGVKPNGRAGAFVASSGGDLNSLWYNPANLSGLEATTLTVDMALVDLNFEFTRAPRQTEGGETITYPTVQNAAAPKTIPQILVGGQLPIDGMAWGFGIYAPYLGGHTFPEGGPQRYTLVDNNASLLAFTHLAVGWQINDGVRIGAGFQNLPANFVLVNVTSAYTGLYGRPEDEDLDILTRITMRSLFNPTGNFGATVQIGPNVLLAMSAQLPVRIRDRDARIETRLPDNAFFANAEVNGDSIDGQIKFPLMLRAGAAFTRGRFNAELAAVYENWATLQEVPASPNDVTVEGVPGVGSIALAPLSVPLNYRDTFSVRAGFRVDVRPDIAVRAGYAFESSAVPDEYYSVFLADAVKNMVALGGTYSGETWSVDAGFSYFLMPDRNITNSQVRQINPTDPEGENTTIVGNGLYSQRYMVFGLGFNKRFGTSPDDDDE